MSNNIMSILQSGITFDELNRQCEEGDFDTEHAEYIMDNADSSVRPICNGHMLTVAQEDGYLFKEFVENLWFTMFKSVAV